MKRKAASQPDDENDHGCCQWIDGEPAERVFCGQPLWSGAWCIEHYQRVHLPFEQQGRRTI